MEKAENNLTIGRSLVISVIVFFVFLGYVIFLRFA